MSSAVRRRRVLLAISVVMLAVVPWLVSSGVSVSAQVVTTSTTEPTTVTTPAPTTTTRPPAPTTTRPRATTTTSTTTTTTTTLPPTTTTSLPATTTTTEPRATTTTIELTTTSGFIPIDDPEPPPDDGSSGTFAGLPGWSLPIVGAGAMLVAIVLATGLIRFATDGIPAIGRGFGTLAYKTSNGWSRATTRGPSRPSQFSVVKPTFGARIGGFFLALLSPFRRIGRLFSKKESSARRLRLHRRNTLGGLWDGVILRARMTRARFGRTRSSMDGQKRYWWLRFRRYIPWLR